MLSVMGLGPDSDSLWQSNGYANSLSGVLHNTVTNYFIDVIIFHNIGDLNYLNLDLNTYF